MILTQHRELAELREHFREKKIVFCSGCFDLTHVGHVIFFENCKRLGDILVVGVGDDRSIKTYKGHARPICHESIRLKMVDSLKPVDYSFLSSPPDCNDLFSDFERIFSSLKPDIYAINEDAFDIASRTPFTNQYQSTLIILEKKNHHPFADVSTTAIIEKIKQSLS